VKKKLLKDELVLNISKAKLTEDNMKQVKKEEREKFIEIKLLEVNYAALKWALEKKVVTEEFIENEPFIMNNEMLKAQIFAKGGLAAAGLGGGGIVFGNLIAPVFLGFGGGIGAIGALGVGMIALPVAAAGLGILAIHKYQENKGINMLIEYFEKEKKEILEFYVDKIEKLEL
jgi:hypothetical protein